MCFKYTNQSTFILYIVPPKYEKVFVSHEIVLFLFCFSIGIKILIYYTVLYSDHDCRILFWFYSIILPLQPKVIPNAICGICQKGKEANKKGKPEALIHCSQCDNSGKSTHNLKDSSLPFMLVDIFSLPVCQKRFATQYQKPSIKSLITPYLKLCFQLLDLLIRHQC